MGLISAIILLGVLVFIHEFGHFIFAKKTGVLVERFSIGFGPVITKWQRGETEYALSAIPLGGYVKMYGEQPDAEIDPEKEHRSFANRPIWARFLIVFAGPLFNILLAVLIYAVLFMTGTPRYLSAVGGISADSPAQHAGLAKGDMIKSIDGKDMRYWDQMTEYVQKRADKQLSFTVDRNGKTFNVVITPKAASDKDVFGEGIKVGRIGVARGDKFVTERSNPVKALKEGFVQTYDISKLMIVGVVKLFEKVVPADSVGGPIMIVQMAKQSAETGAMAFFAFMAVISINLGILNLLPIPVLDGGHILFLIIETIIRRPVSIRVREIANMFGISVLMGLMFFAFYNDIMRFFK